MSACISAGGHVPYPRPEKAHLCLKCGKVIPTPDPFGVVVGDVLAERRRQDEKWGEQDHDPFTWLAILTEEVGETAQGSLKAHFGGRSLAEYREEMVQVAAVAVAALECLDRQEAE